ncbi:hypothetical protein [Halobellus rufus]|uniref:hypothetical protein n=1 Tax=Halobellus rufus TaxID=1448860 RepID=UPI000678E01C|nr:hypothetical protein [Halobellus rufus]
MDELLLELRGVELDDGAFERGKWEKGSYGRPSPALDDEGIVHRCDSDSGSEGVPTHTVDDRPARLVECTL